MSYQAFSPKQRRVLTWWTPGSEDRDFEAIVCDGAVRSGKTLAMGLSFFLWAMTMYDGRRFGVCGKTIASLRRNVLSEILPRLEALGAKWKEKRTENLVTVTFRGHRNQFYIFGGRDESSASLIQGITFAGILLDEVALMPRSFVEQACARCSVAGSRLWFNCNPAGPGHWFYKTWILEAEQRNCLRLHFTMEDNPSLTEAIRQRYQKLYSGVFYRRFILGQWAQAEGRVYDFFEPDMVRLTGGFGVKCVSPAAEQKLTEFLRNVPCGRGQVGIESFLGGYLDSLLTYGRAIGEMVVAGGKLRGVCWGDVTRLQIADGDNPLEAEVWGPDQSGKMAPLPYQHLLLLTTLNPEPAHPYGVSLFRGMPFLADILMKIYAAIGTNWERAGNARYSVICKAEDGMDPAAVQERGRQVAQEWAKAMEDGKNGTVRDFVAVGDVQIKVIGGEAPILDSQVPVRQILEQLVAKTGLPPFLLGLNWSTTERMSAQQADILTGELWALRRTVEPVLRKVCKTYLALEGLDDRMEVVWDEISLQDMTEQARAELYKAQAAKLNAEGNMQN